MSKPTTAASSEEVRPDSINPLSDDYINRLIREHGYDSTEVVIARLWQWIGLNGGENSVTLLMYEAHKALSKLRAPVSDIRKGFELTYAADADDPACASDLSHFTNGWRACIMSQVRAPVADERQGDIAAGLQDSAYCAGLQRGFMLGNHNDNDGLRQALESRDGYVKTIKDARDARASAPVAGEAQPSDADISGTIRALESESRKARADDGEMGVRVTDVMIARAVLARYGHFPDGLMVDMTPPATARDRWMYEQGRLAERDPRSHAALQASEAVLDADHPVFTFLLGEGPLRGVEFGDRHPDERGAYWWRKDLRAALSAQPGAQKEQSDA